MNYLTSENINSLIHEGGILLLLWQGCFRIKCSECSWVLSCSMMLDSFVTPWAVACQAPLTIKIFQARILERVAISSSRGPSLPRDGKQVSCVSCIGRWVLYHWATWEDLKCNSLCKIPTCQYICIHVLSCLSCVQLFATLWTLVCQAPLSLGFSRQEYWSRLPCPPPGDLPDPGMEPASLSPSWAGGFFTTSATQKVHISI